MPKAVKTRSTASSIRLQIERGGEKLWRHNDFRDEPFPAVAQTLSRLTRNGTLERLSDFYIELLFYNREPGYRHRQPGG